MSELQPSYNFPWQTDDEGAYLSFKQEGERYVARASNTILYLFPDQPHYDHIFIITDEVENEWLGVRLFRQHIDTIGKGAFSTLVDQMFENDFEVAPDEVPSEADKDSYREHFGQAPSDIFDKIVELAMRNIDAEIDYYLGE